MLDTPGTSCDRLTLIACHAMPIRTHKPLLIVTGDQWVEMERCTAAVTDVETALLYRDDRLIRSIRDRFDVLRFGTNARCVL